MFVAGETGEPTSETTALVEQIVHEQVFEMVRSSYPPRRLLPFTDLLIAQKIH